MAYLSEHDDAEETKRCIEAEGRRCILLPGDVKDMAFCRSAVERTVREFGKLDVLVNNAGGNFAGGGEDLAAVAAAWEANVRGNVLPSVLLTTAGMQPFKPYFLGAEQPPAPRVITSRPVCC